MFENRSLAFHEVLEIFEALPEEEQETFLHIIQNRIKERGRERIIKNVRKARKEFERGEIRQGTVDELMKEMMNEKINME